jgi:hypothetical protein
MNELNRIPVTNNWLSDFEGQIGYIQLSDSARASFLYEMLKMRPDSFRFEIGYSIDDKGKYHLTEVSLVNKYPKYHPIILKRRLEDKIRTTLRKLK